MILLFTSKHCIWCRTVRDMILEESSVLGIRPNLCEIDIDRERLFATVFGVRVLPTLIFREQVLRGLPDVSDLRTFLLQAALGLTAGCPDANMSSERGDNNSGAAGCGHSTSHSIDATSCDSLSDTAEDQILLPSRQ